VGYDWTRLHDATALLQSGLRAGDVPPGRAGRRCRATRETATARFRG